MVVTDESFAGVMTLFAIAITDKKEIGDGLVNTQEKNQDILIDGLVADQFSDLSPTEQKNVKEVLRALLNGRDGKEIMNFIHSDPKLFYSVVFSAYKEKTKQKEIMEVVTINLNKIIADTKFINRIEQMISDKICGFSLEDVISQAKVNPADKAKMATEVEKAGERNPDIFAQMMKTGLSEVI